LGVIPCDLGAGVGGSLQNRDVHQKEQLRTVVVAVLVSEQSAEEWNVLEDRHARLLIEAVVFDVTAQHDSFTIAHGECGGCVAAGSGGEVVVADLAKILDGTEVWVEVKQTQAAGREEGVNWSLP